MGGFRHWVFIKGSTVDRLGFVTATGEPARYVVRLWEGTDPGAIFAVYDSRAAPLRADQLDRRCPQSLRSHRRHGQARRS
jgi:hypothetical protein